MICILAHGGASSRDDPEGGAGSGVLRPRLVTAGSGGPGHRPPGMMTWLRGARSTDPGGNAGDGSAAPGRKSPRWSAERRASRVMGRAAPHSRGSVAPRTREQQHKCACRRSADASLKPMNSQYNLCQLATIPGSFPVRWPGHAGSSLFAHCGRQRGWASTARGTDVCPVGGLTGFRQALPPPIHRMIWIERPAIEANIGSEPHGAQRIASCCRGSACRGSWTGRARIC